MYITGKCNTRTNFAEEHEKQLSWGPYTEQTTHIHRQTHVHPHDSEQVSGRKAGRLNTRNIIHTAGWGLLIKFWWPLRNVIVLFCWKVINQKLNTSSLMPLHPLWILIGNEMHYSIFKYIFKLYDTGIGSYLQGVWPARNGYGLKRSVVSQTFSTLQGKC